MQIAPALRAAVVSLLAAAGTACESEPQEHEEEFQAQDEGGPYADVVRAQRGNPVEERLEVYRPLAQSLRPGFGKGAYGKEYLATLVRELAAEGDLAVVDVLERESVDRERKRTIWETVARKDPSPDERRLLEKWARANREEICLARFRPGGVAFLLARLEDKELDPVLRARCAHELAWAGDASAIPRMRALADDETRVRLRSVRAGSGTPTLSEIVRKCIEELERSR